MADALVELAKEMFEDEDTHATLWGRAYDLSQEESLDAAAEWFAGQVRRLLGAADMVSFHGARYEWGPNGVLERIE